jgi:hypothetical protein
MITEQKDDNQYSCCLSNRTTDKRLLTYISQLVIGSCTMIFCGVQLLRNVNNNEVTVVYLPILTSVLGYFLPNPTLH